VNRTGKALVAITGVGLLASLAVGGAAQADPTGGIAPYRVLVAQGSDTTQDVVNGLSNVITANGSNYRATGLLYSDVAVGATSIQTSLLPTAGASIVLEADNASGVVQAGSTTTAVVLNFVPRVHDVLTIGGNSQSVASVAIGTNATTATATMAAPFAAVTAGDAVTGHQQETVTVSTITPAVASTGVGNVATPYNVVTLTAPTTKFHSAGGTVMGAFVAAGDKVIASYDAQGGAFQSKANANCKYIANNGGTGNTNFVGTTQNGVSFTGTIANSTAQIGGRANGSGNGRSAVSDALTAANGVWGCTDFARSSGTGGITAAGVNGAIDIPFALDGITFAVTTTSNYPRKLTFQNLLDIYSCNYPGMIPASTPASAITAAGSVQAYAAANGFTFAALPQSGSGTRSFVNAMLGNVATLPACVTQTKPDGTVLEEHDLRTIDDNGIAPVSIAQAITQRQQAVAGVSDKQGRTVLIALDNTTSTGLPAGHSNGALNYPVTMTAKFGGAAFDANAVGRFWRDVYNVVPVSRIADPNVQAAFVGPTSAACTNDVTLELYGFAPNPNCGSLTYAVK
jgi:hypothetical protein